MILEEITLYNGQKSGISNRQKILEALGTIYLQPKNLYSETAGQPTLQSGTKVALYKLSTLLSD